MDAPYPSSRPSTRNDYDYGPDSDLEDELDDNDALTGIVTSLGGTKLSDEVCYIVARDDAAF